MALSEPIFTPEALRNLAKDNGPEYAGRSRRALRWCADVIEAADAVVQESAEVRKDDEALIRQMRNALYALPLPYTSETRAALQAGNEWLDAAIAERARLEKAP